MIQMLYWAVGKAMTRLGYEKEMRRTGDLKLALWRKRWDRRDEKTQKKRLVMIPGFGDTPFSWISILGMIRHRIRSEYDEIVLVEFPGFAGLLAAEKPFHSMELLKTTLYDALDSLQPECLIGHSLGGWLASLYAAECAENQRPKRQNSARESPYLGPAKLILLDASGLFASEQHRDEIRAKFKTAFAHGENGYLKIREFVFENEPFWLKWVHPVKSKFFATPELEQFVDSFQESHLLTEERISKITGVVWLIWGEQDKLIPSDPIELWLRALNHTKSESSARGASAGCRSDKLQRCQAVLLKNCGHSPHLEAPLRLAWVLEQALRERHSLHGPFEQTFLKYLKHQKYLKLIPEPSARNQT